jgi:hypothetical protein
MAHELGNLRSSRFKRHFHETSLKRTALRIGRPKDLIRITQFLEDQAVDMRALCDVIDRHGLKDAWTVFCRRTGITDPCKLHFNP